MYEIKLNIEEHSLVTLLQYLQTLQSVEIEKIIKKRFETNTQNEDWIPFYVGKSEKVGKRIWEHLNHHKKHATYGLKFNERSIFKLKNEIKVGYWLLPVDEKIPFEIKQFIITNFESVIRKKLNPWIGKQ